MSDLAAEPLVAEPLVTSSRKGRSRIQTFRSDWPVLPPLGLSLVLHFWALTSAGWGNAYYAAAVRAMRMNWRNFLFAAAEPGGFVSVDKPPLALWVQTISSWIFGYNKFALLAPQALAGSAAVIVLYFAVKQVWGRTAGTVAAFVLALTPINVMVNHSNNMDAVLVLVMTIGAFFGVRAAMTGRLRTFVVACALAGTAVTAKMLAAVPLMPALLVAYLWCAPLRWTTRLRNVGIGIVVLAVSGLWWFAVVDLTPAGSRPYVGSSPTNSAFQLAFERNGVGQVEGTSSGTPGGGPGGRFGGGPGGGFGGANRPNRNGGLPNFPGGGPFGNGPLGDGPLGDGPLGDGQPGAGQPGTGQPGAGRAESREPNFAGRAGGFGGGSGGRGGAGGIPQLGFNGGSPGPLRLFNEALGAQAGWLIPFALVASFAALVLIGLRGSKHLAPIIVFGGWFVAAATAFSMTKGIVHPYYLSNLGPPVAGLAGIGAAALIDVLRRGKRAFSLFVPVAVAASAAASWTLLTQPSWSSWRPWLKFGVISALILVAVVSLIPKFSTSHRRSQVVVGSAVLGSLIAPALWTQSSLASGVNANLPFASAGAEGAGSVSQNALRPNGGFTYLSGDQKKLVKYLEANHRDEKWQLAVQSAGQAEPFVISHAMPVMIMGGFIGSDPILTEKSLRAHIASGDVRYFLTSTGGPGGFGGPGGIGGPGGVGGPGGIGGGGIGGGGFGGGLGGSNAAAFVADECSEVPASEWGGDEQATGETVFPGGPTSGSFTLYDCGALRARP